MRVWHKTSFFPLVRYARSAYSIFFAVRIILMSVIYLLAYFVPPLVGALADSQIKMDTPFVALGLGIIVPFVYLVLLERLTWNLVAVKVGIGKEFTEFRDSVYKAISQFGQMALIPNLLRNRSFKKAMQCFSMGFVGTGIMDAHVFRDIVNGAEDWKQEFGESDGINYILNMIGKNGVDSKTVFNVVRRCSS